MKKFRFLEWRVYKEAKELFSLLLKIVKELPKEYRYELGSQIIRSGFSVVLNIAEGSGKSSDRELNRFLEIALGSVFEVLSSADVLKDNELIDEKTFNIVMKYVTSISDQLGGFKKKLKSRKL
jgi:four helix bundle protein